MSQLVSVRAQTILYKNDLKFVERSICSIANAVRVCKEAQGPVTNVEICFGDASPQPTVSKEILDKWNLKYGDYLSFSYTFFGFNSGTSKGQNILFKECKAEYLMLYNPDVVVCPSYFTEMLAPYNSATSSIGMVEAKQIPLEHPKAYDHQTGEELWGAMACVIVPSSVYSELNGLDEKNFFMYCDDVDFSWRIRLSGRKVIYRPNAAVFHGHRLNTDARSCPTEAELYYSAEAALLLAYKWSATKHLNQVILACTNGTEYQTRALKEYRRREQAGTLPQQLDAEHKIAYFVNGCYSKQRFTY